MVATVTNAYIDTFESNVRYAAQQKKAKLRGKVHERGENSKNHSWDIIADLEALDKTTRLTATPVQDYPWTRRVAVPTPFHSGDSVEDDDIVKMLIDPKSSTANAIAMAMNRGFDDKIITAATGDAVTEGGGTAAYDYTNQAAGAYTDPISFDLVTAIQEIFMTNDIDPMVPKCAVVGPTQVRKLMQLTQQTSSDYVAREALQSLTSSGIAIGWMGFDWIMSTRLLAGGDTGGGAGTLDCLFFTMDAMGMNVPRDTFTKVAEDPSVSFAWRIYAEANAGAVRVQDDNIVVARVLDALA